MAKSISIDLKPPNCFFCFETPLAGDLRSGREKPLADYLEGADIRLVRAECPADLTCYKSIEVLDIARIFTRGT